MYTVMHTQTVNPNQVLQSSFHQPNFATFQQVPPVPTVEDNICTNTPNTARAYFLSMSETNQPLLSSIVVICSGVLTFR